MNAANQKQPRPSQRNAYIVMAVGGLLVVALIGWALMRSFQAPVAPPEPPAAAVETSASLPTPEPQPHVPDAEHAAVPRMMPEDLRQKIARGEVTVIDVRDADAYLAAHIPGSLHIPFGRIEGEIPYLPREKPIVTYCT